MKNFCLGFCLILLIAAGCGKNGSMGNTGPTGPAGPIVVQSNLQNGIFPTSSYNGELDTWLDSANVTIPQNGTSYRRVKVGYTASSTDPFDDFSRAVFRFDVSSIPVNATIEEVRLLLTTESSTNLGSSSVTIGLHTLAPSLSSGCTWTSSATWNTYSYPSGFNNCDGDSSIGQKGIYDPTPLSTVVFDSTFTGTSKVVEYEFPASVVEGWITGTNNGLILVSEGEFQSVAAANVDFYPYNDATATNRPQLIITYE
jgi:hypothetical protein